MTNYTYITINDVEYSDIINGKVIKAVGDYNVSSNFSLTYKNICGNNTSNFPVSSEVEIWFNNVPVIEDTGLELSYAFDSNSTDTASGVIDASGNGLTGTYNNLTTNDGSDTGITYSNDGYFSGSNAATFNGTTSKITITDNATIQNIWSGGGTISCYVKPNSDGEGDSARIFDKSSGFTKGWYLNIQNDDGNGVVLAFQVKFNGGTSTYWYTFPTRAVLLNQWNYIAISYNSDSTTNDATIQINDTIYTVGNGLTQGPAPVGSYTSDVGADLLIGNNDSSSRTFDGDICNVRFWKGKSMSTTEMGYEQNSQYPVQGEYLVGSWDLNGNSNDTNYLVKGIVNQAFNFKDNTQNFVEVDTDMDDTFNGTGYTAYFDGSGPYVQITDQTSIQNIFDGGGTVCGWIHPISDGENNLGRVFDKNRIKLYTQNDSSTNVELAFVQDFDGGTNGVWSTDSRITGRSNPIFVAIVYDNSSTSNNPTIYYRRLYETSLTTLTVGGGITEDTTPTGTRVSDVGDDLYFGNTSANNRSFQGDMCYLRAFSSELSEAEILAESNSSTIVDTSNGLFDYHMDESISDATGNTSSVDSDIVYTGLNPFGLTGVTYSINVWSKFDGDDAGTQTYTYLFYRGDDRPSIRPQSLTSIGYNIDSNLGQGLNYSYAYNDDSWHMYTLTYDGLTMKGYIDGVEVVSRSCMMSKGTGMQVRVGCDGAAGREWRGPIDDTNVFSRILKPGEIQALYNSGNPNSAVASQGTKIMDGLLEDIKIQGKTGHERITITGRDFTSTLQDITIPPEVYTNLDVSDIIDDFMAKYSPDVTYTPSTYGYIIERISFNHTSIFDALKRLADRVGAIFYVNESKQLIFVKKSINSSGVTFDNTNIYQAIWDITRKEIVNQVWVYGDRTLSGFSEIFTGDGVGSVFTLKYKPHSLNVQVSGVQQVGAIYEMTNTLISGVNYLVNYDEKQAIFVSGTDIGYTSIPGSLDTINVSYDRELPIVKRVRNVASIRSYKLKEEIIQDNTIKDPNEAVALATSKLKPNPFTKGTLNYDGTDILTAGQTCVVNFSNDGINSQVYDMLQITYDLTPTNILNDDFIKIVVNKKIKDVTDTIKDLIQDIKAIQASQIQDTEVLTRVEFGAGSFGFRTKNWKVNQILIGSDFYVGSPSHPNGWVGSPGSYYVGSHIPYSTTTLSGGTW